MPLVARRERLRGVFAADVRGERHRRQDEPTRADLPDQGVTVFARHPDIAHQHVETIVGDLREHGVCVGLRDHQRTLLFEDHRQELARVFLVVDDDGAHPEERLRRALFCDR